MFGREVSSSAAAAIGAVLGGGAGLAISLLSVPRLPLAMGALLIVSMSAFVAALLYWQSAMAKRGDRQLRLLSEGFRPRPFWRKAEGWKEWQDVPASNTKELSPKKSAVVAAVGGAVVGAILVALMWDESMPLEFVIGLPAGMAVFVSFLVYDTAMKSWREGQANRTDDQPKMGGPRIPRL